MIFPAWLLLLMMYRSSRDDRPQLVIFSAVLIVCFNLRFSLEEATTNQMIVDVRIAPV